VFEPKITAFGALSGFVLSFFVGLVSGAAITTVLIRALMMAVLSGSLVLVIRLVITHYLPELQEGLSKPDAPVTGSAVDISIVGDPVDFNPYMSSTEGNDGLGQPVPDFLATQLHSSKTGFSGSGRQSDDFGESFEHLSGDNTNTNGFTLGASDRPAFAGGTSSVSVNPGTNRQIDRTADMLAKVPSGSLDSLPEMEDFQAVTSTADYEAPEGEPSNPKLVFREGLFQAPSVEDSTVESETMAKAIRTMLSRDTQ